MKSVAGRGCTSASTRFNAWIVRKYHSTDNQGSTVLYYYF